MAKYKFNYLEFLFSGKYIEHLRAKMYAAYPQLKKYSVHLRMTLEGMTYTTKSYDSYLVNLSPDMNKESIHGSLSEETRFKQEFLSLLSDMAFKALHEASHIAYTSFELNDSDLASKLREKRKEYVKDFGEDGFEKAFFTISNIIEDEVINRSLALRYQGSIKTAYEQFLKDNQEGAVYEPYPAMVTELAKFACLLAKKILFKIDIDDDLVTADLLEAAKKACNLFDKSKAIEHPLSDKRFRIRLSMLITFIFFDFLKEHIRKEAQEQLDWKKYMDENEQKQNPSDGNGEFNKEDEKYTLSELDLQNECLNAMERTLNEFPYDNHLCPGLRPGDKTYASAPEEEDFDEANCVIDSELKELIEMTCGLDIDDFAQKLKFQNDESFVFDSKVEKEATALAKAIKKKLLKTRNGRLDHQKNGRLDTKGLIRTRYSSDVFTRRLREDRLKEFKTTILLDVSGSMGDSSESLNKASIMLDTLSKCLDLPIRQYIYNTEAKLVRPYNLNNRGHKYLEEIKIAGCTNLTNALSQVADDGVGKEELILILADSDVNEDETLKIIASLPKPDCHFLFLGFNRDQFTIDKYPANHQHYIDDVSMGSKFLEIIANHVFC